METDSRYTLLCVACSRKWDHYPDYKNHARAKGKTHLEYFVLNEDDEKVYRGRVKLQ